MKIVDKRKSIERCTESGWDAFDLLLDENMDDRWIEGMRRIKGSFMYMRMLKSPFFKLESDNYVLKGVRGDAFFRIAVHRDYTEEVEKMIQILNSEE